MGTQQRLSRRNHEVPDLHCRLSLQSPSVAVIFVMMELVQSVMMVPRLSTTDLQERILMAQSTSHLQFAMVRELLLVLMDQPPKFASTPAVTMRRNAQLVRAREHLTSLLLHVPMAQSASVQEEERTANSTTEYVATDKDAGRCAKGQPHCPWWTKNRNKHDGIREFNTGDSRPGNKGHNWGPDFAGNQA